MHSLAQRRGLSGQRARADRRRRGRQPGREDLGEHRRAWRKYRAQFLRVTDGQAGVGDGVAEKYYVAPEAIAILTDDCGWVRQQEGRAEGGGGGQGQDQARQGRYEVAEVACCLC